MPYGKNIKLKVLFIAFLAINSFVFINQADAQTAPNFSRDYNWSGSGGDWSRVTFDLNTELASPSWQKINSDAQTRGETFIDSNNDGLFNQFSFERYARSITDQPGCDYCPPLAACFCQPLSPNNLGQLICTDPWGNNTGPTCSIQIDTPYDWSATYRITGVVALPATPSGFQITGTGANCSLNLSWNDLINEDSYEIERSVDGVNSNLYDNIAFTGMDWNNGVSPDNAYSYRIRARNLAGVSSWSPTIRSRQIFCRTYRQYGVGDWNNYSLGIGEELLQWGASWNLIGATNNPEIDYNSTSLLDTNNNNYLDTFSARIKSSWDCKTDITCIPGPSGIPICSTFNQGAWNNDNNCIDPDPCWSSGCRFIFCWPAGCYPPPPIIPNQVNRPFMIEYSIQGFRAVYVDLKINNLDGLNLEAPDTQADASWISENTILPCIAATIINGQPAINYGLPNLWNGSRQVSGSENLGILERGLENPGQGRQYNFSITCDTNIGNLPTVSDIVNVGVWKFPIIDNFNCDSSIIPPQAANCAISVRNADQGCIISGGSFSDTVCLNESECLNDSVLLRPSQTTNFTLTCSAIDGNRFAQQTIAVSVGGGVGGGGGSGGGGGAGGSGIWRFFKNIIWREVIPR